MNQKTTIKDIQKETGLSLGTISKYLNGGSLKEENIKIIEKAIEKLDYRVDLYARSMITGKTNTIGVVIPEIGNAFYGSIVSYLAHYLRKYNYDMVVKEYNNVALREKKCVNWFIDRKMDAIICFSDCNLENLSFYQNLNYKNLVFVDNQFEGVNFDFFGINNYEISKEAITYLFNKGHTKISGLFLKDSVTSKERLRGFIDAYKDAGIPFDESLIHIVDNDLSLVCDKIKEIIKKKESTAIFASNYITTLGAIFTINEQNIKVPEDISLLGFDNIMLTKLYSPKITIIEQPLKKIAEAVILRIMECFKEDHPEKVQTILECSISEGSSVKQL